MIKQFKMYTQSQKMKDIGVDDCQLVDVAVDLSEVAAIWENEQHNGDEGVAITLKSGVEFVVIGNYPDLLLDWHASHKHAA